MGVAGIKKQVVIGEDTFEIGKLSWKSLDKASRGRGSDQAAYLRELGGELMKALRDGDIVAQAAKNIEEKNATPEGRRAKVYDSYDRASILTAGVERINGELATLAAINLLDKTEADILFRAIVDLSDPPAEEAEAAQGEASGRSTGS